MTTPATRSRRWRPWHALRTQLRQHKRRDSDQHSGHWWWLPVDPVAASPWPQLLTDLLKPAPFGKWHLRVVEERISRYDRLRPFVTRGLLLVGITGFLAVVRPSPVIWLLLTPAAVQVTLEIFLHRYVVTSAPVPRLLARVVDIGKENYRQRLLNLPGIVGSFACPLNIVAVLFASPGGSHGWAKIAALAAAIFYLNSGLGSTFLDPPNFTEISTMPEFMHSIRAIAPVISCTVVEGLTAGSVLAGRWEQPYVPLAFATSALALLLGGRIREHDRILQASVPVLSEAVWDARKEITTITHNHLQEYRDTASAVGAGSAAPTLEQSEILVRLPAAVRQLTEFTDPDHDREAPIPLRDLPRQIIKAVARYPIALDITDLNLDALSRQHAVLAETILTGLCWNAAQAIDRAGNPADARIVVRGWSEGEGRGRVHHLWVYDTLPPVPQKTVDESKSLQVATRTLIETDGDIAQVADHQEGGKAFHIWWPEHRSAHPLEPRNMS